MRSSHSGLFLFCSCFIIKYVLFVSTFCNALVQFILTYYLFFFIHLLLIFTFFIVLVYHFKVVYLCYTLVLGIVLAYKLFLFLLEWALHKLHLQLQITIRVYNSRHNRWCWGEAERLCWIDGRVAFRYPLGTTPLRKPAALIFVPIPIEDLGRTLQGLEAL